MTKTIVDRDFAEQFLTAVDDPFDLSGPQLFSAWFAEAPQDAIDAYVHNFRSQDGAEAYLAERWLAEPLALDDLADCAPGTLGHGYRSFIVDHGLMENLATDYRAFHERMDRDGAFERLPDDLAFAIVRGFQTHDFLHTLTGFNPNPLGELAQAGFHFAQVKFPYHAFRVAVTTAHLAFVRPGAIEQAMDAIVDGWIVGRAAEQCHFHRWEDELHTPLDELRTRFGVEPRLAVAG